MHSAEITKNKKTIYAIIIACLFNTAFLVVLFFFELHHPTTMLEPTFLEPNLLLELLAEAEPSQKENTAQEEAGLMIRGAENGTLPPSLCSDFVQTATSVEPDEPAVSNNTDNTKQPVPNTNHVLLEEILEHQDHTTPNTSNKPMVAKETASSTNNISPRFIQKEVADLNTPTVEQTAYLPEQSILKKQSHKSKKSLAQMTQAALHTACSQGNAAIFSAGDKHKLPSELQLAEEQYWIKLERAFHNASISYQHLFPSNVTYQKKPLASVVIIYLPNGLIKNVSIDRSSGDTLLDQAIITIFKEVQTMAPPLPAQLRALYSYQRHCTIYH